MFEEKQNQSREISILPGKSLNRGHVSIPHVQLSISWVDLNIARQLVCQHLILKFIGYCTFESPSPA